MNFYAAADVGGFFCFILFIRHIFVCLSKFIFYFVLLTLFLFELISYLLPFLLKTLLLHRLLFFDFALGVGFFALGFLHLLPQLILVTLLLLLLLIIPLDGLSTPHFGSMAATPATQVFHFTAAADRTLTWRRQLRLRRLLHHHFFLCLLLLWVLWRKRLRLTPMASTGSLLSKRVIVHFVCHFGPFTCPLPLLLRHFCVFPVLDLLLPLVQEAGILFLLLWCSDCSEHATAG